MNGFLRRTRDTVDAVPALAWASVAAAWLLAGLLWRQPWKADEGYSFGLVLSMLRHGDFLVPTLAGEPFLEKPPLVYWIAAGTARLFGSVLALQDAARIANLLLAVATFVVLASTARIVPGRRRTAAAVLWLAASPAWLIASRFLTADLGMVFGAALATRGLVGFELGRPRAFAWLGAAAAFGFLSKGLLLPGVLAVALLALVAARRDLRTPVSGARLAGAAGVATALSVSWPVMLWMRNPAYLDTWLWANNVGRFLGENALGPANHRVDTVASAALALLPAWPAAVAALRARPAWTTRDGLLGPALLAGVWAVVIGVSATARVAYLLPVVVPLALLASAWSPRWSERRARALGRLWLVAGLIAVAAALGAKLWLMATAPASLWGSLHGVSIPLALLALAAGAGVALLGRRGMLASPLTAWVCGLTLAWCAALALFLRPADETTGYHDVFTALGRHIPDDAPCVASRGLGETERALLEYYADQETLRIENEPRAAGICGAVVEQERMPLDGGPRDPAYGCPGMRVLWQGSRPEDRRNVFRLCVAESPG